MHVLLQSMPPTLQQTTTTPPPETPGHPQASLLWGHCSFLLGPLAYKLLFVPSQSLFPQFCVTSGGSMVGLMVTYSKRAYAIRTPRAPPLQQTTADPDLCRRRQMQFCLSLCGFLGLAHTRSVGALWASLAGMGFDSKCELPLLPSCWGFSFALGHGVSPHSSSSTYHLTGVSLTLDVGYLQMAGPAKCSQRS